MSSIKIGDVRVGGGAPLVLIAGPCVIESEHHAMNLAESIAAIANKVGIPLVFKASYDKANRSSVRAFRGIGFREGLDVLSRVRRLGIPVITDVHETVQVREVADVADCLQIPAFLSRQTDLVLAASRSGRPVNLKKSQQMAPWDVELAIEKVRSTGNQAVMVTERGTAFGYNNLVVDLRGLVTMREFGVPLVFDGGHSVQRPGAGTGCSTGDASFISALVRGAVAVGVDAVFLEVHDDPRNAQSDGPNSVSLPELERVVRQALEIEAAFRRSREF